MVHRKHLDSSIKFIGELLFGIEHGSSILETIRKASQPLVDDWDCLKRMVTYFPQTCNSIDYYMPIYIKECQINCYCSQTLPL